MCFHNSCFVLSYYLLYSFVILIFFLIFTIITNFFHFIYFSYSIHFHFFPFFHHFFYFSHRLSIPSLLNPFFQYKVALSFSFFSISITLSHRLFHISHFSPYSNNSKDNLKLIFGLSCLLILLFYDF